MKSILVALLIVILAISFHFLKKKTDLLDGIFPARSEQTPKKTPRKSPPRKKNLKYVPPAPQKKPAVNKPAPRKIDPVRIRERKNGMIYYSVVCPHCQKLDKDIKQTRELLPGR